MDYHLYLLYHSIKNRTYLGITNNLKRRWRQHNGEIKGGARATSSLLKFGQWQPVLIVSGFSKSNVLSIEKIIKNKRNKGRGKTPLEKRIYLIKLVLSEKNLDNKIIWIL